jgi:hypothetical protein
MMNEDAPDLRITVCKLVMVSLLEVFKDVIPTYQIKHQDTPGVQRKVSLQHTDSPEPAVLTFLIPNPFVFEGAKVSMRFGQLRV